MAIQDNHANTHSHRSDRRAKRRNKNRRPRKLLCETLQSREVFAALTPFLSGNDLIVRTNNSSTTVHVRDIGTKIEVQDVGANKKWTFSESRVKHVKFTGGNGNDRFVNYVRNLPVTAYGGSGNDYLEGYHGADKLVGGSGNDTLLGYGGNDKLYGGSGNDTIKGGSGNDWATGNSGHDKIFGDSGNDTLYGYTGNDKLYGGSGNDMLSGWTGNDKLYGGSGHDKIYGYHGNDTIRGGSGNDWATGHAGHDKIFGDSGNDTLYGYTGNDEIHGGSGNDTLSGWSGNDTLYGDSGTDKLYGHSGDDGLFGGVGSRDYLNGGTGDDRFLTMSHVKRESYYKNRWDAIWGRRSYRNVTKLEDTIADRGSNDALVQFRNLGTTTVNLTGFGKTKFAAGRWTDANVKTIDVALANLHRETRNTKLLKKSNGGGIVLQRAGRQLNNTRASIGGWNGNGVIAFTNTGMSNALNAQLTTYHEFAHNWDDTGENRYVRDFRKISRWDQTKHRGDRASTATGDRWYYNDSTRDFARAYGRFNPYEDYATTWETYFGDKYHNNRSGNTRVVAKLNNVAKLMRSLT